MTAVVGLLFSENFVEGIKYVKTLSNLFFIYLMVSNLIDVIKDDKEKIKKSEELMLSFIIGLSILDVIGFSEYLGLIGERKYTIPLRPLNVHHIWLGNLNAVGLYAAVGLLLQSNRERQIHKAFITFFIILSILTIILSTSRTAWAGVFITSVVFFYLIFSRKRYFLFMVSFIVASALLLFFFNSLVHQRITMIFSDIYRFLSGYTDTSIGARFVMWKASVKMFLAAPIFGVGTGDYVITVSKYVKQGDLPQFILRYNQPHNLYMNVLATNGIIGILALIYLFCAIFKNSRKLMSEPKTRNFGFVVIMVAVHYMSAGLTESLFNIHMLVCNFAFVMGILLRYQSVNISDRY
jgi:O-antigen ligase